MVLPEVMAKTPLSSLRSKDLSNALRQKLERGSNPFRHRKYFTASLWHKCGGGGYRWDTTRAGKSLSEAWFPSWQNLEGLKHSHNFAKWKTALGKLFPRAVLVRPAGTESAAFRVGELWQRVLNGNNRAILGWDTLNCKGRWKARGDGGQQVPRIFCISVVR